MPQKTKEEKPHYLGHRERLREQFLAGDEETMPDYKLLELLLTYSIPRRDVSPLAKNLINTFGGFTKALGANRSQLYKFGLTNNTITLFGAILESGRRVCFQRLNESDDLILKDFDLIVDYCRAALAHLTVEEFRVIFLDAGMHMICEKLMQRGTVDGVSIHPREVAKMAVEKDALSIIMMHNHPGGTCSPSQHDIKVTQDVIEATDSLKIKVQDHIIITPGSFFSFRQNGMLPDY